VAFSTLLTTAISNMKNAIDGIQQAGLRNEIKFISGDAPMTQAYADQIGGGCPLSE